MICIILFKHLNLLTQHMLIIICQWLQYQYLHHHLSLAMYGQPTLQNCVPPLQHSDHLFNSWQLSGLLNFKLRKSWLLFCEHWNFQWSTPKTSSSSIKNPLSAIRSRHLAVSCLRIHCFLLIPDPTLGYSSINCDKKHITPAGVLPIKILLYCVSCSGNKFVTEL